jgi:AraC family transcriptional regulator
MPRLEARPLVAIDRLGVSRVACDGRDASRPEIERMEGGRVIVALRGRFEFRDAATRAVVGPTGALFLADGHEFQIRHPHQQGDVCLAVRGDLADALLAAGPPAREAEPGAYMALMRWLDALERRRGAGGAEPPADALRLEEELAGLLGGFAGRAPGAGRRAHRPRGSRRPHRDGEIADAIAHEVALRCDERLTLGELAAQAGVSMFHACRAFRRAMGISIHRYQAELRLRHALALVLDTSRPLTDVAYDTGFANQGHFGNAFRKRFGAAPSAVRRHGMAPVAPSGA